MPLKNSGLECLTERVRCQCSTEECSHLRTKLANMERGRIFPEEKKKKIKKTKKTKKKKKPLDNASIETAAENAKKELLELLMTKTELSEEEIVIAYDEFHEKYPSGAITRKEFLAQSKAGQFIAEALFRVFDSDESGNLNFSEFIQV